MQYYLFTLLCFGFLAYWFNRHISNYHHTKTKTISNKEEVVLSDEDKEVLDKDQREDMRETIKLRCIIIGVTTLVLLVLTTSMFKTMGDASEINIVTFLACSFVSVFVTSLITTIKLLFNDVQLLKLSDIQKFELAGPDKTYKEIFATLRIAIFINIGLMCLLIFIVSVYPNYVSLFTYQHSPTVVFYLSFATFLPSQFSFGNRISPNVQKICLSLSVFLFALFTTCIPK